jgi:hypothetical protein
VLRWGSLRPLIHHRAPSTSQHRRPPAQSAHLLYRGRLTRRGPRTTRLLCPRVNEGSSPARHIPYPRSSLAAHRTAIGGYIRCVLSICRDSRVRHLGGRLSGHLSSRLSGSGALRGSGSLSCRLSDDLSRGDTSGGISGLGRLRSSLHSRLTTVVEPHNRGDQSYERGQEGGADHRNHRVELGRA